MRSPLGSEPRRPRHRGYVPTGTAVLGQGVTFNGPVTINGVRNIDELGAKLDKRARKKPRRGGR
jgi:hypothetical protein